MKKVCKACKEEKDIVDFPKNGKFPYRSTCKPCWSSVSGSQAKERLLKKKPEQYVQCSNEDCLNIWSYKNKHRSGVPAFRWLCPHCGSKPDQ